MTTKDITQLHARLTVYEFLLEILYGQQWATRSAADARQMKDKIVDLIRLHSRYPQGAAPPHDADAFHAEVIAAAENLLEKASVRADAIRRQLQDL